MTTPIRPVDEYCQAIWDWLDTLVENHGDHVPDTDRDYVLHRVALAAPDIRMAVMKSSYLNRRIYGGEAHRTERCPEHNGVWCGVPFYPTECGCDLTGWLPKERDSGTKEDST